MEKLNRGDKIFLDKEGTKESEVNDFLSCRDGIVEVYEYRDTSGYGSQTRLFLCENTKHESVAIIRQVWADAGQEWKEQSMHFDSDSFEYMKALLNCFDGEDDVLGGKYTLVRFYGEEN